MADKTNNELTEILDQLQALIKEQKQLNSRIQSLNRRMGEADPAQDEAIAKKVEKASQELCELNEAAMVYNAVSLDPWQFVEDTMQQAVEAKAADDDERWEELHFRIGIAEEIDEDTLETWQELRRMKDEGVGTYRGERWAADTQVRFAEIFEHINLRLPFPDASPDASW